MVTIWASRRRPYSCAAAAEHCAPVPRRDGRLAEEASVSEPDIMFRDPRRPVDFGKTFVGSDGFKALFREGMLLVEDTAAYLDGPGRDESKALSRHAGRGAAREAPGAPHDAGDGKPDLRLRGAAGTVAGARRRLGAPARPDHASRPADRRGQAGARAQRKPGRRPAMAHPLGLRGQALSPLSADAAVDIGEGKARPEGRDIEPRLAPFEARRLLGQATLGALPNPDRRLVLAEDGIGLQARQGRVLGWFLLPINGHGRGRHHFGDKDRTLARAALPVAARRLDEDVREATRQRRVHAEVG